MWWLQQQQQLYQPGVVSSCCLCKWRSVWNIHTCGICALSSALSAVWIYFLKKKKDVRLCERHLGKFPHSQSIHKFCGAGPAVAWKQPFSFACDRSHTCVLFAALASISILLQHCLEHGKMFGIVSVGSLGGKYNRKACHSQTRQTASRRHLCNRVEMIHWHQMVHFYSWNSHSHQCIAQWTNKKNVSLKYELTKKVRLISAFHAA